jgi:hypothetical protein
MNYIYNNKQANTTIKLPELGGSRVLKISTSKGNGEVETYLTVGNQVEYKPDRFIFETAIFSDFSKSVGSGLPRATEKNIKTAHEAVLNKINNFIEEIKIFYTKKAS